ncbi:MAG TPA: multifunctional oxoglutarate decarboxylase/oxoglutarate dehydrogenase thiamine pyrophosphate-binding subunit/dihydrolipoyllysine-residue succinyltransferase subunit [Gaiellaceae bacterium]|nr:multifunctional oxoglutarate decarboxylase/oxoglutarate dehydrogenase thiamine pyrophosphate-binding subunit/dihydrolipoyllysine-residue succinyltransferase subunit [Gaiellaceae bacterium]
MSAHDVDGLNAGYARLLLEDYLENPDAVPAEWRELFESGDSALVASHPGLARLLETLGRANGGNGTAAPAAPATVETPAAAPQAPPAAQPAPAAIEETLLGGVAAAMALVKAHRMHGHLAARLDPLGSEPLGEPALDEARLVPPLTPELQSRIPAELLRVHVPGDTLLEALPALREVYCGTLAYEIEHISDHAERVWLRQSIESGRYRTPLGVEQRLQLLDRVSRVEAFEQYLRRAFLGQKQFSLEGLDTMVPMLDEAIDLAAEAGAHEIVIGMAHRGRLNVLAHTVGRSYESILREFEGERQIEAVVVNDEGGTGDVKYHLAATGTRATEAGEVTITLAPNPSHLEAVDPVIEGWTRAEQTDRSTGAGIHDPSVALPILIHGDASFAGQGVVAETLNLSNLDGYTTGGTLHLIANNQVGFTTDPNEGRSTRYSSDLAKGFDIPIVHVNADDPEAAISAIRLALAYRQEFGHDIVVDLVGYRRFGHNEQDEAAYTQPLMVQQIADQPTVRERYVAQLVEEGVITPEEAEARLQQMQGELRAAHDRLKASIAAPKQPREGRIPADTGGAVVTAVPAERLEALNEQLLAVPEGFVANEKLLKQLERRRDTIREGGIDWGQAEALAFASLLTEGIPIRLSGQDTERGTFSHRHAVLHDQRTGETHAPVQHLPDATASFEIYNSPLSEYACLGFEYGYAVAAPDALVLWEAQFGDFVNGAQIVIDQFLVAGLSKWGQTSRLTLLLPHGYEGNGPEHSSAKLERFLQLAAQENIRVANCTTAAQYFHLVRRQALDATARPLVVMTPKGLLRLKQASSTLADLAEGRFEPVLDDPGADRAAVTRLVLTSGKLYYDIQGHEDRGAASSVAVARLEQLYPFPVDAAAALAASYPNLRELLWSQEEPQNMGAWRTIRHRLESAAPDGVHVSYVGRPWRASPSEGYPTAHRLEQDRIVRESLRTA